MKKQTLAEASKKKMALKSDAKAPAKKQTIVAPPKKKTKEESKAAVTKQIKDKAMKSGNNLKTEKVGKKISCTDLRGLHVQDKLSRAKNRCPRTAYSCLDIGKRSEGNKLFTMRWTYNYFLVPRACRRNS